MEDMSTAPYPTQEPITPAQVAECIHHLKKLTSDPQQLQMLEWLQAQDGRTMMAMLGQMVSSIPQEQLPAMIEEHIGAQPEEVKAAVREQISKVYTFFLSCSQTATVPATNG